MNPSKIISWKVRGLNSSGRQNSVRMFVNSCPADDVCIQETKMAAVSRRALLSTLGSDFDNYVELLFTGVSGGILVAWRHCFGPTIATKIDSHCVSVQFCHSNGQLWWLTCVYGPEGVKVMTTKSSSYRN